MPEGGRKSQKVAARRQNQSSCLFLHHFAVTVLPAYNFVVALLALGLG